ncbi:uncharacterized protein LOC129959112 [Argiope bruennichi]|uniref:uncharacterized protein LOC129959112 n=1 Tax=Argiope bruennichi TaxID=94029 RepID=UPI0024956574|nr:uncharacterized protein LOC129959112 [Argiope bruennichi]
MADSLNREKNVEKPIETGNNGSNSEDKIPPYSDHEAVILAHKLINYETFIQARRVLIAWYQNGECNANNYGKIFFLTQICFDYQRIFEAMQKEVQKKIGSMREMMALQNFDSHCNLYRIEKTIKMMENPEIYDGFSPSQKERIQAAKNEVARLWENFFRERICNTSVEDGSGNARIACNERNMLLFKQFSDSLRLEVVHEEVDELRTRCKEYEQQILMLKSKLAGENSGSDSDSEYNPDHFHESEAELMGLMSIFLYRHSSGVNIDNIHSYINTIIPTIDAEDIEIFLRKFPGIFAEVDFQSGKRWFYVGSYLEPPVIN